MPGKPDMLGKPADMPGNAAGAHGTLPGCRLIGLRERDRGGNPLPGMRAGCPVDGDERSPLPDGLIAPTCAWLLGVVFCSWLIGGGGGGGYWKKG